MERAKSSPYCSRSELRGPNESECEGKNNYIGNEHSCNHFKKIMLELEKREAHTKENCVSHMDPRQLLKSMANNGDESNKKLHIVRFPWLAFGLIIPFLELSKFIAQKGHKISFISTPRNIDRLPNIPSEFSNSITFVKNPLPKTDGLPKDAEATMDITKGISVDGMEQEVTIFLEKNSPVWIIQDFAQYWLAPISAKLL
ncbi:hypothetical protein RND71_025286 [Anisodus tanguticus]|uniref:Uncharacterized protein n=1 Tax=Anisodus tanguticus TaxID=243964 RepID=A0AAE1RPX9_9SOLA|nr:hypothetical protein RND71_025286 [Anisodus tanguticus]